MIKITYKILRSLIFTLTLFVVGIYVLVYVLFSIPVFTNAMKDLAAKELSALFGGEVNIQNLQIYPFNEVKISGLQVLDPTGEECLNIATIGAGINLWKFITRGDIELSYGEIIGLNANIVQQEKDGALNIDFVIKALSSKDNKQEKKHFELALRNVVLRKSKASFRRPWLSDKKIGNLDLSNLQVEDLAADITFPKISDQGIDVDLRRLSLMIPEVTVIKKLSFTGSFSEDNIRVAEFILELPQSRLFIPDISLLAKEDGGFIKYLKEENNRLDIFDSWITPEDFAALFPILAEFPQQLPLEISARGNLNGINLEHFQFGTNDFLALSFSGGIENITDFGNAKGDISDFKLFISHQILKNVENGVNKGELPLAVSKIMEKPIIKNIIREVGDIDIEGDFAGGISNKSIKGNFDLATALCKLSFEGGINTDLLNVNDLKGSSAYFGQGELTIEDFRLKEVFPNVDASEINANIVAEGKFGEGLPEGMISLVVDDFVYKGKKFDGFSINLEKEGENIDGDLLMHNAIADIEARFKGDVESDDRSLQLDLDLDRLDLSQLVDMKNYNGYVISTVLNIDLSAHAFEQLAGEMTLNNLEFASPDESKVLKLKKLQLTADHSDSIQNLDIKSDWFDLNAHGALNFREVDKEIQNLVAIVFPSLVLEQEIPTEAFRSNFDIDLLIKKNNALPDFFNLPVRLLVPVNLSANFNGNENRGEIDLDIPYLQQGKDKLIYDNRFTAEIDGNSGMLNALIETTMPVKRGDLALNVNIEAKENNISTDIHWINTENSDFKGHLAIDTEISKPYLTSKPEINVTILPSVLDMGTTDWHMAKCKINYSGDKVTVEGLKISHEDQFVEIEGVASPEYSDEVIVKLADIDVDYVFDMLQINYVTFGGTATGEITGHALLSGNPVAETESLIIKDFTYNGASLGECEASSRWNNDEKEIEIGAKINKDGKRIVNGYGGIWLGRDSLSFDISAMKVPVEFVQPFMEVFSSHVGGFATGDVKLFGTFHDIDMTGKIFADSVAIKLDYTNTIYHGSDSVYLNPGRIEIPHFRLYDKYGNSAMLTGELTHRYFHEPSFTFRLSDAENFLCYDTNSDINPDWYGVLFGTGSANLNGVPGITDISADMTVSGNSTFTFVLNDTEYAHDYQFLTFSDKRAEAAKVTREMTPRDMKELLKQSMHQEEGGLSKFGIDIRATVTPQVLFTLVMDPAAGDKITARGSGAMQVKYESDNDEMMMYGKYEIEEGNYNFSLQDIILRDFKIKEGSYISFNGNPLAADLDISATYRVNTNLSDLDKSFSTDRDLNRTNVPVDAVLNVTGNMTSPDITFDIELPTLTQDVERKVKSIISTDDMMNRQIIYLLALNRFYTPEYMGMSGNGGELAAVASSTLSSQLSNILGQLTDKFSVSPSFRSDKGDFSDIEVDVALSSRLLNNRLLINGNFGYRDRSTSSTTFVGDFDVEYLLSKNGNIRLKAYNHFNDQNYYLREALTTQGLGIVYRKDFDDMFRFLRKKKKKEPVTE